MKFRLVSQFPGAGAAHIAEPESRSTLCGQAIRPEAVWGPEAGQDAERVRLACKRELKRLGRGTR